MLHIIDLPRLIDDLRQTTRLPIGARYVLIRQTPFHTIHPVSMERLSTALRLGWLNLANAARREGQPAEGVGLSGVGMALHNFAKSDTSPPPDFMTAWIGRMLSAKRLSAGAIFDDTPIDTAEAARLHDGLFKFSTVALLDVSDADLLVRAADERRCMGVTCKKGCVWERPPLRRPALCTCNCLMPSVYRDGQAAEIIARHRAETAALVEFYTAKGVPQIVIPAGNDFTEDMLVQRLWEALKVTPVVPAATEPQPVADAPTPPPET